MKSRKNQINKIGYKTKYFNQPDNLGKSQLKLDN